MKGTLTAHEQAQHTVFVMHAEEVCVAAIVGEWNHVHCAMVRVVWQALIIALYHARCVGKQAYAHYVTVQENAFAAKESIPDIEPCPQQWSDRMVLLLQKNSTTRKNPLHHQVHPGHLKQDHQQEELAQNVAEEDLTLNHINMHLPQ